MNETAFGVIIGILATLVAALARVYLSARGDAIRSQVMLKTEHILRQDALEQLEKTLGVLEGYKDNYGQALRRVVELQSEIDRERSLRVLAVAEAANVITKHSGLDDQTKALVRLATSNPNEHERHAAAALVCKRLREKIDA